MIKFTIIWIIVIIICYLLWNWYYKNTKKTKVNKNKIYSLKQIKEVK
jgi:hypothetical protein